MITLYQTVKSFLRWLVKSPQDLAVLVCRDSVQLYQRFALFCLTREFYQYLNLNIIGGQSLEAQSRIVLSTFLILTHGQEECEFRNGYFHPHHSLCSQVNT